MMDLVHISIALLAPVPVMPQTPPAIRRRPSGTAPAHAPAVGRTDIAPR